MTTLVSSRDGFSTAPAMRPSNLKVTVRMTEFDGEVSSDELRRAAIVVIADDQHAFDVQRSLATEGYLNVIVAEVSEAQSAFKDVPPDLLVLDATLAIADDFRLLRELRGHSFKWPVLLLMDSSKLHLRRRALEFGAADFLYKPVDPQELSIRVRNALISKVYRNRLLNESEELERQVRRRTADLTAARAELIHCLARAAEFRDDDTGLHVVRVGRYVGLISRRLGLPESYVDLLELASQLHDIGKIGVPDEILHKPGTLDPEQWERMQQHVAIGHQIIQPLKPRDWELLKTHARLGGSLLQVTSSPLLVMAAKIAQTHHERWDGSGYPLGLAGEDIPIEGRITAVADVYDALSSKRPYKKPFPRAVCFQILEEGRGKHFDPQVLDAFFACREEIVNVQLEYMDPVR